MSIETTIIIGNRAAVCNWKHATVYLCIIKHYYCKVSWFHSKIWWNNYDCILCNSSNQHRLRKKKHISAKDALTKTLDQMYAI